MLIAGECADRIHARCFDSAHDRSFLTRGYNVTAPSTAESFIRPRLPGKDKSPTCCARRAAVSGCVNLMEPLDGVDYIPSGGSLPQLSKSISFSSRASFIRPVRLSSSHLCPQQCLVKSNCCEDKKLGMYRALLLRAIGVRDPCTAPKKVRTLMNKGSSYDGLQRRLAVLAMDVTPYIQLFMIWDPSNRGLAMLVQIAFYWAWYTAKNSPGTYILKPHPGYSGSHIVPFLHSISLSWCWASPYTID